MIAYVLAAVFAAAPKTAANQPTLLVIDVKPPQVVIFLDDRKIGTANKVHTVKVKPGQHLIKLKLKKDSAEDVITVKKGQKRTWSFDMTDSGDPSQKPKPEPEPEPQPAAAPEATPPPPPPPQKASDPDPDPNREPGDPDLL